LYLAHACVPVHYMMEILVQKWTIQNTSENRPTLLWHPNLLKKLGTEIHLYKWLISFELLGCFLFKVR
jgi:hypothetical protein